MAIYTAILIMIGVSMLDAMRTDPTLRAKAACANPMTKGITPSSDSPYAPVQSAARRDCHPDRLHHGRLSDARLRRGVLAGGEPNPSHGRSGAATLLFQVRVPILPHHRSAAKYLTLPAAATFSCRSQLNLRFWGYQKLSKLNFHCSQSNLAGDSGNTP